MYYFYGNLESSKKQVFLCSVNASLQESLMQPISKITEQKEKNKKNNQKTKLKV